MRGKRRGMGRRSRGMGRRRRGMGRSGRGMGSRFSRAQRERRRRMFQAKWNAMG